MSTMNVSVDLDSIKDAVSYFEFVGGNTTDAVRIAINKTEPIAKTRIAKAITGRVNLKASYVKGKIKVEKAYRTKLSGRVYADSAGLSLAQYEYGAKASLFAGLLTPDTPIRVKVRKGGGQIKTVKGDKDTYGDPFLFRLRGRSRTDEKISYGIGGWRKSPGPRGGRIKMFLAPSVSQEFDEARDSELDFIADKYQSELLNAMNYILKKQNPKE
jgi:hypothetical protein